MNSAQLSVHHAVDDLAKRCLVKIAVVVVDILYLAFLIAKN